MKLENLKAEAQDIIRALGLVFGDIGTSPIYTLTVVFLLLKPTPENILGVLSLVTWTMTVLVSIEYAYLAMSLAHRGEGGTIVLRSVLLPLLKSEKSVVFFSILTFVGVSLLIGDGVITPAISILSAVEGIVLLPGFEGLTQRTLLVIAGIITLALFSFQRKGTDKVAGTFGPIMLVWFIWLALSGLIAIFENPSILSALNPWWAVYFFKNNGIHGLFILSEVILCATGGEALYADMGHLGRKPIVRAWVFVFVCLILNYFGQATFLLAQGELKGNLLFSMILKQTPPAYVLFLILSILATIIASQAVISAMFSLVYQGMNTRILPLFRVHYTSTRLRSQIYIGFVNWFLLVSVLFMLYIFRESKNLAAAYGLAVTGTMTLTGIFMVTIFFLRRSYFKALLSIFVTIYAFVFFVSNTLKIPHGAYWSLVIAAIPLLFILVYTGGQRKLYKSLRPLRLEVFLPSYKEVYNTVNRIRGTALFFARSTKRIPTYVVHTMFNNNIVYDENIIVTIETTDKPFGVKAYFSEDLAEGLKVFKIEVGYMEVIDIEKILRSAGINEKAIFYGQEEITTENIIWKLFYFLKRLSPPFVQFYDLPGNKLHGVITRVEM
ncbi:MAG: KUP/HAK/KT family potassium transporter [Deltaproteobacteria bacterium]|nr:KUP/HAK/KT family potassium transporter [Deltaproteobacteria bacterium]